MAEVGARVALLDATEPSNGTARSVLQLPRLPPKPVWINRGSAANGSAGAADDNGEKEAAKTVEERRLRANGPADCSARIKRFDVLNRQDMSSAPDPLFAADRSSIASPHESCGDTAQGVKEACVKFNRWGTFADVARRHGTPFRVFGPRHVEYHDIGQGQLGTCYFLAAVASVAYSEPKVIKNMFVRPEKWDHNVFTTRWLLNGKVSEVEVDDMIPAQNGQPFFVQPSHEGEFWPIILEKTWSKIFTSFKAAEAGFWENVVNAITRAPTRRFHHDEMQEDALWNILLDATNRRLPMAAGAGDGARSLGMATGHAYSVFRASTSPNYGRVVEVFNPWHRDFYKGRIPNRDHEDGSFAMTFAEYRRAFDTTSLAVFRPHYHDSYKVIQRESQSKTSVLEFEVKDDEVFYVSLNWPSQRMVKPCRMRDPKVTLAVAKADDIGSPVLGDQPAYGINSASAKVSLGPGKYVALASADFPDGDFIDQVVFTVYAASPVDINLTSRSPLDVGLTMFGPSQGGKHCAQVMIEGRGLFIRRSDFPYGGVPTYWSFDEKEFAYFVGGFSKWFVTSKNYWPQVQKGELWHVAKLSKSDLTCGCSDSQHGVAGFQGVSCADVKEPFNKYSNVKCASGEYAAHVQRYCPATCGPLDVCGSDSAEEARFLEQSEAAPPSLRPTCEDHEHTGITINGGESMATCEELGSYCFGSEAVRSKCCASCEREAERVELSNGATQQGEGMCYDDDGFRFTVSEGDHFGCAHAAPYCETHDSVRERCCETCQQKTEEDLHERCFDDPNPGIVAKTVGADTSCPNLKDFCFMETVQEACCETCKGASSWTSWLPSMPWR